MNVGVASQVIDRNFKKITEMLGFDCEYTVVEPKMKFWSFSIKNCERSALKNSIEKRILVNFVILLFNLNVFKTLGTI